MSKKLLLIGCGQLGSRHLQAAASVAGIVEIHVIDPLENSLELGRQRLKEINDLNPEIKFAWHTGFNDMSGSGDLCVIATQAAGRVALIKEVASRLGYRKFLIEKIVAQSVAEYQELIAFADANNLSIWVNCKTRAYGIHKYIKSKIDPNEPIIFSDFGGNHGLANNGVHSADIFVFYDETNKIKAAGTRIDPLLLPSKRGKELFDLSGTLFGTTEKGSDFILSFSSRHNGPDHISIVSKNSRFIVDHFQKFAFESYAANDWQWQRVLIDENWSVSYMSKKFISDILTKGQCELPTAQDCYPAHEFILSQLKPHFDRLLKIKSGLCPVT